MVAAARNPSVVPDLEAGNLLSRQLAVLVGADAAGIVLGARVPVLLATRTDNERTRLASCALAVLAGAAAARRRRWRNRLPRELSGASVC